MNLTGVVYGLYCACPDCVGERRIRYVGQTRKTLGTRMTQHLNNAGKPDSDRIGGLPVYRWMRKHGPGNIQVKILDSGLSNEDIDDREIHWIRELGTFTPGGYNMTEGGCGKSGYRHSEETKRRISAKKIGVPGFSKSGLTDAQVEEIKFRLWNGETQAELAVEYGVTRKTLKDISQQKVKLHVPWPIGPRQRPRTGELRARQMEMRGRDEWGRVKPAE